MKHNLKITIALVMFFFLAQVVGLFTVNNYIDHKATAETQTIVLKDLPYGFERPYVENQSTSFIYVGMAILIGTILLMIVIRTKILFLWKIMFFIAVATTLAIAFSAFFNTYIAGFLALLISLWRLYRPNALVHNVSEIFIYGGLAALIVNIFNLIAAFMLLILVSIYDYIAVYRTKHMVEMAKFQSKAKVFAGLFIPYAKGKISARVMPTSAKAKSVKGSAAVLGGGDIGFTLLFASVVMKGLMLQETVLVGFLKALIIPIFATFALIFLLVKGQKNKFYPAMPVLSIGCFIGYFVIWLY